MKEDQPSIEDLKEQYKELKEKYSLPEFTELNQIFEIEDTSTETEFLLRRIRRAMSEKITGYLRFIDVLLNPSNAPIFFFRLVKKLDKTDMDTLSSIYQKLGSFEIQIVSLDLDYSEKKEAEFVNNLYKTFNEEIKKDFLKVMEKLNVNEESVQRTNGSYFG